MIASEKLPESVQQKLLELKADIARFDSEIELLSEKLKRADYFHDIIPSRQKELRLDLRSAIRKYKYNIRSLRRQRSDILDDLRLIVKACVKLDKQIAESFRYTWIRPDVLRSPSYGHVVRVEDENREE